VSDLRLSKDTGSALSSERRGIPPWYLFHKNAVEPTQWELFGSLGWKQYVTGEESPKGVCPVPAGWLLGQGCSWLSWTL
jgi:hypothetical protein